MINFGVTVKFRDSYIPLAEDIWVTCFTWYWNGNIHDIFGAAMNWEDGEIKHLWHGQYHRYGDGPSILRHCEIAWWYHDTIYRDPMAPAGTDVEWLRGATIINEREGIAIVNWCTNDGSGITVTNKRYTDAIRVAQVRAEIDYWWAQE
jgi:hypothetical protein